MEHQLYKTRSFTAPLETRHDIELFSPNSNSFISLLMEHGFMWCVLMCNVSEELISQCSGRCVSLTCLQMKGFRPDISNIHGCGLQALMEFTGRREETDG